MDKLNGDQVFCLALAAIFIFGGALYALADAWRSRRRGGR